MKIGLEFEGVIRSSKTGGITRWPQISEKARDTIKRMMFERREKVDPIDTYDCLAEVRTPPMVNPSPVDLISALYTEMESATRAFLANGYFIQWFEQEISDELHKEIQYAIENPVVGYKTKKETYAITDRGCVPWESEGNRFRGGGLHINVSSVPRIFSSAFVTNLHTHLSDHKKRFKFESHYRNNILFRCRYNINDQKGKEPIAEYMSFGFNVSKVEGWKDELARIASSRFAEWYDGVNFYDHIRWAWTLTDFLKQWNKEVTDYQTLLK